MRRVNIKRNVFKFDELSKFAQEKVITEYIEILLGVAETDKADSVPQYVKEGIAEAKRMRTPWFVEAIVYQMGKTQILQDIRNWEYFENGDTYFPQDEPEDSVMANIPRC